MVLVFGTVIWRSKVGKPAPIAAASFLCNGVEQKKDIAESGERICKLYYRFASKIIFYV